MSAGRLVSIVTNVVNAVSNVVKKVANVVIPPAFPVWYLAPALVGTILLALLVTVVPIRRAVHYRPGDALRYT